MVSWIWVIVAVIIGGMMGIFALALVNAASQRDYIRNEDTCIFCGETVPEGRMVCPACERKLSDEEC